MEAIRQALDLPEPFDVTGHGDLPSCFGVTELAIESIAAVGLSVAQLLTTLGLATTAPPVTVDRRLASLWFARSIYPVAWSLPPVWDAIAGDYRTSDGWIKLHTNLTHHRLAALRVLECPAEREQVAAAVRTWTADELELAVVEAGGVAAALRSRVEWQTHPQGRSVAAEPLITWQNRPVSRLRTWTATRQRPLAGLRVLDLTRVLAGPVATRTLAGFGATVLRIDPPDWDEPNVVPDVTLGKRCARLDLRTPVDRSRFEALLADSDLLIHGYRPDALAHLGYDLEQRTRLAPALIEVSLDAYGWTGPWAGRRGFDSLVQMSSGIAATGSTWAGEDKPVPLPVQALDHATGYLMAATALRAIDSSARGSITRHGRLSLARTAEYLQTMTPMRNPTETAVIGIEADSNDLSDIMENTPWGNAKRVLPPLQISGTPMHWSRGATTLGSSEARWPKLS